jgi:hypothetical protein
MKLQFGRMIGIVKSYNFGLLQIDQESFPKLPGWLSPQSLGGSPVHICALCRSPGRTVQIRPSLQGRKYYFRLRVSTAPTVRRIGRHVKHIATHKQAASCEEIPRRVAAHDEKWSGQGFGIRAPTTREITACSVFFASRMM